MTDDEIVEAMCKAYYGATSAPTPEDWMRAALAVAKPLLAEQCAKIAEKERLTGTAPNWSERELLIVEGSVAATKASIARAIRQSVKAEGQP